MSVTGVGSVFGAPQTVTAPGALLPGTVFLDPNCPNIADFLTFLATSVQIPRTALPVTSPWPSYVLPQAIALVNTCPGIPGILYTLAVYNGATHLLFLTTPDVPGQNYFMNSRGTAGKGFGLIQPSTGIVVSSSDQGTSSTLAQPRWADGLTIGQLGFMKTPWGRAYLDWQQSYGPTIVGLT